MTEPIHLNIFGNWYNIHQFQQEINQYPLGEPLVLDVHYEAPSLHAYGVTDVINAWLADRCLPPTMVHLTKWCNPVEIIPYCVLNRPGISHFVYRANDWWQDSDPTIEQQLTYKKLFGLFIGRMSIGRAVIFYQSLQKYPNDMIVSREKTATPVKIAWHNSDSNTRDLDNVSDWVPLHEQAQMFEWYDRTHIPSIDDNSLWIDRTGFISSLLQHYHNFAVEIVCETWVHGNTFFPTEKTTRPIMAAKPIMVFGPRYYLARLRIMGFKTYHDIWDESYDLYEGPERWHHMQRSMQTLSECSQLDQHRILSHAHDIAMFNRQRLWDIIHQPLLHFDYSIMP